MKLLICVLASLALAHAQQRGAGNCPEKGLVYFPDNSQCDKYFECRNGEYTEQLCPDGLLFDASDNTGAYPCKYVTEVDCEGRSGQQAAQPTENCGRQWGYYGSGDRADCGYFYNCVNGHPFQINCPAGLAFSSATYRCEWADESVDCDAKEYLGFECPESANPIQILLDGYSKFRSPRDCRQFFICVNRSARLQFCQLGLVYNEATATCDEPETVQECKNYYTTEELAIYREMRERAAALELRRQEALQQRRDELATRRRQN